MMSTRRHKTLMQESLDERLPPEARRELFEHLDADPVGAAEYNRLREVDRLLRHAPMERAPQRMAMHIMARLAEGLQPQMQTRLSGLALALALSLVAAVALPLLMLIGWMLLNAIGSAAALNSLMETLVSVVTLIATALGELVRSAQNLLAAYPETPLLMLALIPVGLFWLLRGVWQERQSESSGAV